MSNLPFPKGPVRCSASAPLGVGSGFSGLGVGPKSACFRRSEFVSPQKIDISPILGSEMGFQDFASGVDSHGGLRTEILRRSSVPMSQMVGWRVADSFGDKNV